MVTFIKRIVIPLFVTTLLAAVGLGAPAYPLKRSANNRYLVDQNNQPVLLVGDSPHALFANLSVADATTYLQSRGANGFNALWCEVLVTPDTGGRANLSTYDGILPFTSANDISTPNPAYFARVDQMIAIAAANGLTVVMDTFETHYLQSFLKAQTATKMFNYGVFLGNRYKNTPNIVWMTGNDFQYWNTDPTANNLIKELMRGIASVDSNHLQTLQLNFTYSGSLDNTLIAPYVTLNGVYNYYVTYDEVYIQYNQPNYMPVYLQEAAYEDESNFELGTPNLLRRQAYWTVLAGGLGGQMYGHLNIWRFSNGWQNSLNSTGARQLGYWKTFITSKAWYNLVPDQSHTVVTGGYGTYKTAASQTFGSANDYVTSARTADGTLVLAYTPVAHTLTVDMTKLSGSATARWFDPAAGTYTSIAGSPFANTGTRNFTTPGNNSAGAGNGDWVLVLEASGGGNPNTAPTISNIGDQSTTVGTGTGAIGFTVGDAESAAGSLTVSGSSSNPTLVPNGNIAFGGSGANRTVTVTPAANQSGSATIMVSVSDGVNSASDTFVLTVSTVNQPPLSGLEGTYFDNLDFTSPKLTRIDSTINFDWGNGSPDPAIGADTFSARWVGQIEPLYSQTYTFYALTDDGFRLWINNQLIIDSWLAQPPTERASTPIALTAGTKYDIKIEYYENSGGAVARLSWSSPSQAKEIVPAGRLFPPPVTSPGGSTAPTISNIPDQTTTVNTATAAIPFTINDADTAVGSLTLSKGSSNPTLVPVNNIVFGGSGANRTVTVTPVANQTGTATITVTVSDGVNSASDTFVLTVNAANPPPTIVLTSPNNGASYTAPTTINLTASVTANSHTITKVQFFNGTTLLGEDTTTPYGFTWNNVNAGSYSLTARVVYDAGSTVDSAPANVTVTSTSGAGTVTFNNPTAITIPDAGAGTPYPSTINVSGLGGAISTLTITLRNLTHTWPADIDVLLVGPAGQRVLVMSDAVGGHAMNNITLTLSDAASAALPQSSAVATGSYKPTNFDTTTDTFASPAPAGPYATTLSTFNGTSPNGVWSLYVVDDGAGDQGTIAGGWSLTITTTGAAARSSVFVKEPPRITSINIDNQGTVRVTVSGAVGHGYALEASGDLINWTKVGVQDNVTGSVEFHDQPTTNAVRFYRAVSKHE